MVSPICSYLLLVSISTITYGQGANKMILGHIFFSHFDILTVSGNQRKLMSFNIKTKQAGQNGAAL